YNREKRQETSSSYIVNKQDSTLGSSLYRIKGDMHNISGSITFGRKLNSKGRAIGLSLNASTRGLDNEGKNWSETSYQKNNSQKIIDQLLSIKNENNSWSFMFSYVEPLGKGKLLQLSYNYRSERS